MNVEPSGEDVLMESGLYPEPRLQSVGDRALLVEYGDRIDPECNRKVRAVAALCQSRPIPGVIEVVPAYRSLQIVYNPLEAGPAELEASIRSLEERLEAMEPPSGSVVKIPVCYGQEFGPDLSFVAEHNGLSPDEVIEIHSGTHYLIYMLGFTPGFPFLGGLDQRLHTPRRESPRTEVPKGSVGIANGQTGIYPLRSPGGWQLIGRTPHTLFQPHQDRPTSYAPGDTLVFVPISREEYLHKEQEDGHG